MEIYGIFENIVVSMALINQLHPNFGGYRLLGDVQSLRYGNFRSPTRATCLWE